MSEITRILEAFSDPNQEGERGPVEFLFPLIYDELRLLAKSKLAGERKEHTLQPTDLVHEAFMRLVGNQNALAFQNRRYFFAAASEAMRRILVEAARKKMAAKRGSNATHECYDLLQLPDWDKCNELVEIHDALDELAAIDPQSAEVVKLRYFAGFTMEEIAEILGVSKRKAQSIWAFARAWLFRSLKSPTTSDFSTFGENP